VTNAAGNFLGWGVVVPLYAVAILATRALPPWIGWLGLLVGLLAGWLGLLSPASTVIAGISSIGFIGFFVFMLSMGIALLRRRSKVDGATQASAHELS
jgi:XapX domain-containing protein